MSSSDFSVPSLPHYIRAWGGEVRRVTAADLEDVEYDTTIPIDFIFKLKRPGEVNYRLMVRKRCNNCLHENKPCIRQQPCNFCHSKKLRCTYASDPMPLPKKPVFGDVSLMARRPESEPSPGHMQEVFDEAMEVVSLSETSFHTERDSPKKQRRSRKQKDPFDTPAEQITVKSSPRKRCSELGATSKMEKVSWTNVDMNGLNTGYSQDKIEPPQMPYIWAEHYTELLGSVPLLSTMTYGISADVGPSPMVFVNNTFWSGLWSGTDVIRLSTARNYSRVESALKISTGQPTGLESTEIEMSDVYDPLSGTDEDMSLSDMELSYPDENDDLKSSFSIYSLAPSDFNTFHPARLESGSPSPILHVENPYIDFRQETPQVSTSSCSIPQEPNSDISVPESRPDSIATLYKAFKERMPVSVIMDTTWAHFPFYVDERCRYAVLGFFHITDIETSARALPSSPSKNGYLRVRGQVTWTFTLRWVQGGPLDSEIPLDIDGRPQSSPCTPWWLSFVPERIPCTPSSSTEDLYEPFFVRATILSLIIFRDAFEGGNGRADASRRAWLCTRCGKLGITNWIGAYACSHCKFAKPCTPRLIRPYAVRNRQRFVPMWEPSVQVPDGVKKKMRILENELRHFTYIMDTSLRIAGPPSTGITLQALDPGSPSSEEKRHRKSRKGKGKVIEAGTYAAMCIDTDEAIAIGTEVLVIELLFPGNRAELETDADHLFKAFQAVCPMRFERSESNETAGIYTFRTGPGMPRDEGYSNWRCAPQPVIDAKNLMVNGAGKYLRHNAQHRLNHLSATAWLGESPVKVEIPAHAKENPVLLMCLGGDLDVIFPKAGEDHRSKSPSKSKSGLLTKRSKGREDDLDQISKAGINGEIWGDGEGRETNKALMASDRLRITLTHGSLLAISGGDIDLTIMRSDFAILVRLYDGQ